MSIDLQLREEQSAVPCRTGVGWGQHSSEIESHSDFRRLMRIRFAHGDVRILRWIDGIVDGRRRRFGRNSQQKIGGLVALDIHEVEMHTFGHMEATLRLFRKEKSGPYRVRSTLRSLPSSETEVRRSLRLGARSRSPGYSGLMRYCLRGCSCQGSSNLALLCRASHSAIVCSDSAGSWIPGLCFPPVA